MDKIEYLNQIVNEKLQYIGRTVSMLCLGFGKLIKKTDKNGRTYENYMYEIHIQCSWRLINYDKKKIIFAREDIFEPMNEEQYNDDFDWEEKDSNLFDKKSNMWFKSMDTIYVKEIVINEINDLKIMLSNGDVLEAFIDITNGDECWRFFEVDVKTRKKHLVIYGE